jgi:hypothetical protein
MACLKNNEARFRFQLILQGCSYGAAPNFGACFSRKLPKNIKQKPGHSENKLDDRK